MQNEPKTFMEQKPFKLHSEYKPTGDQPAAIAERVDGFKNSKQFQTLLGVTGSGKTFTMANVIVQGHREGRDVFREGSGIHEQKGAGEVDCGGAEEDAEGRCGPEFRGCRAAAG